VERGTHRARQALRGEFIAVIAAMKEDFQPPARQL